MPRTFHQGGNMNLQKKMKKLRKEFDKIKDMVVIHKSRISWEIYIKNVEARDILFEWLRGHGCQIEQKKDQADKPLNAWLITLSLELCQAFTPRYESIMIGEFHLTEAWHWAPLPRSADLYKRVLAAGHVNDRANYYPKHDLDSRVDIQSHQFSAVSLFIRHFTAIPVDEWTTFIHQCLEDKACTCGTRFVPRFAKFCGLEEELDEPGNPIDGALAILKARTDQSLTAEEVTAAKRAIDEPGGCEAVCKLIEL